MCSIYFIIFINLIILLFILFTRLRKLSLFFLTRPTVTAIAGGGLDFGLGKIPFLIFFHEDSMENFLMIPKRSLNILENWIFPGHLEKSIFFNYHLKLEFFLD